MPYKLVTENQGFSRSSVSFHVIFRFLHSARGYLPRQLHQKICHQTNLHCLSPVGETPMIDSLISRVYLVDHQSSRVLSVFLI